MNDKKILKRLFCLPPFWTLLIAVPSFAWMIYVLAENTEGPLAYLSYGLSAYALVISLTGLYRAARAVHRGVRRHPAGRRWMEDAAFRTELSLYQGFAINLAYIAIKMASGLYYRSLWFVSLAVYYALLAAMRFLLLWRRKGTAGSTRRKQELHRYRLCEIMLLFMNLALSGIVTFMVHQNRGYEYPGTLIYAMAAYSFYAVIMAVVSLVKFRRHGSPILSAAKAINLVAAMVSVLSLETAMLTQFGGGEDPLFRKAMTGATGGGVCTIVLGMAVFMIAKASKQLKELKGQNKHG